ncbi:MAG: C1 family peptidase [Candidatus Omnitrophota bacterium]
MAKLLKPPSFGWLLDIPDQRDFFYAAMRILTPELLFVFGFTVYKSFLSRKVERSGIANMPKKSERAIGGRAVLAVGYNQKDRRFLVRNSWGFRWGQSGYFTMPFAYLEALAADFWAIRK